MAVRTRVYPLEIIYPEIMLPEVIESIEDASEKHSMLLEEALIGGREIHVKRLFAGYYGYGYYPLMCYMRTSRGGDRP
jgi:hypothetical protein